MVSSEDILFLNLALAEARRFEGATAPNPAVGAAVARQGRLLAAGAHEKAGSAHAEKAALDKALRLHGAEALRRATLYVTLEPCNHVGRTGPCTDAILAAGIRRVVYGTRDANPRVTGGGAAHLTAQGLKVECLSDDHSPETQETRMAIERLNGPFTKLNRLKRPWVCHKIALRADEDSGFTMIPTPGAKTFASSEKLRLAHEERKKADAILTGLGTVLADRPNFDVRHLTDHPGKRRTIAVVSRRKQMPPTDWLQAQENLGHEVIGFSSIEEALSGLGERGVLRVLVEAGPALSEALEQSELWDERLTIVHREGGDFCYREYRCLPESSLK